MSNLYNNYKLYKHTNHILKDSIENGDNIIILFGNGGNGKSYLTQEMNSILNKNNYNIFNPVETYEWNETSFKNHLSFSPNNKKIIHLLFNPFSKWDITKPDYVCNIDMSNIHW